MNGFSSAPTWVSALENAINHSITSAKDEIIDTLGASRTRPSKNERGPKNTRMMMVQRLSVKTYVEIECHRHISEVTVADCYHVWHLPENSATWNERAKRSDSRRGYPSPESLRAGVIYWFDTKAKAKSHRF